MLVLLTLIVPVFAQVLDLPDPPPVPSKDSDQLLAIENTTANVSSSRLDALEARLRNLERLLELESRLLAVESQVSQIPDILARLESLELQVAKLQEEITEFKEQAPDVQSPSPTSGLGPLRDMMQSWFAWSLSVGMLALLGVLGIVGTSVYQRLHFSESTKRQLKSYLETYVNQGYSLESLRTYLADSGWDPKLIDSVAKEINDVPKKTGDA